MLVGCATHLLSLPALTLPDVSESQSTEAKDHLPRGILLIEDYRALGVAIASALRKFAPLHVVKVARDFAEAQRYAASLRPELFVIDLDPPPGGEIEFLRTISSRYPGARVLVIAPGLSADFRLAQENAGAIHLIEKPFDLADFGVAVQALVGLRNGTATGGRATLRHLNILDLAKAKCLALSSTVLWLESPEGRGEIHFQNGQIIHAVTDEQEAEAALAEMAGWPLGEISERELPPIPVCTIGSTWPQLLLPLLRQFGGREEEDYSWDDGPMQPDTAGGKKILVIDDTEMLLIFVSEILSQTGQGFALMTALTGGDGLRLAKSEQPDLILLDYSLTDMTGDVVCQELLRDAATARIPILMMSGHPTELARTAETYGNVVAALPKPFLSGNLIKAVETALATGPLPPPPPAEAAVEPPPALAPQSAPAPAPAAPLASPAAPAQPAPPPARETPAPLPNGHAPSTDGAAGKSEPPAPGQSATVPPQASAIESTEPPPEVTPPPPPPSSSLPPPIPAGSGASGLFLRGTTLFVTISLDVVVLELTAALRTASARLEPISRFAVIEMADGTTFEAGFQFQATEVGPDGGINSLRLLPTRQPVPLPAAVNSLSIGRLQVEPVRHHIELKATRDRSMRVQLTAPFLLIELELSPLFEVSSLHLQSRGREVWLRNRPDDSGTTFTIEQVELDPAGELRAILVRPAPND
jgi:DNA-binding response OmpR family regulator